jgi:hypothetical protein|tara:strand:+ start:268 stop:468 length:201 start_codon:yes stop_codon:yes gene_type:complete
MTIQQKASNKILSKLYFSKIKIKNYNNAIHTGLHGGVTEAETKICLESEQANLEVLEYIYKLIKNK